MKNRFRLVLFGVLFFYTQFIIAQEDSLKVSKLKKPTLMIGTNVSMPLFTFAFGGYGASTNIFCFFHKNFGLNIGTGIANYANMGLKGSKEYKSKGYHFNVGISYKKDFQMHLNGYKAIVGSINFLQSQTQETGYWSLNNVPSNSFDYWGEKGYPFKANRQFYGIELSLGALGTLYERHKYFIQVYLTGFQYHNDSYFLASATSGIGYLPFYSTQSLTTGVHIWYYLQLY